MLRLPAPTLRCAFLHLAAVSALGIAQPLLDLLGKNPAFFAAHGAGRWEVIGFAAMLSAGPALVLTAVEGLAGLASTVLRRALHLCFMAALTALFALQIVRRIDGLEPALVFALALVAALGLTAAYALRPGVRSAASVLGVAPVLFLATFVFASPTSKLVLGQTGAASSLKGSFRPPIVVVSFDAFPSLGLMRADGSVDAARFPNLAALASEGRWYPNASSVHENTVFAVPAIIDGRQPRKGAQPIVQDHPNNLFAWLGRAYDMNVAEEATSLCPPGLCSATNRKSFGARLSQLADDTLVVYQYLSLPEAYRKDLPQITDTWAGFRGRGAEVPATTRKPGAGSVISRLRSGRVGRWRNAVAQIGAPGPRPQLNFIHAFFPHEPRQYLPSGQEYQAGASPDSSLEGPPSYHNSFLTQQAWQRALLQAQFADRLVGELIGRLKRVGAYEDALIVITADHGESFAVSPRPAPPFTAGKLGFRRAVTRANAADVAAVPLFIKYPTGRGPRGTDRRFVRTTDVLPTIAQTLGVRLPFKVDGRSLLDPSYRGQRSIVMGRTFGPPLEMSVAAWRQQRQSAIARRDGLFARHGLFGLGPRPDLLGVRPGTVPAGRSTATFLEPSRFRDVDPAAAFSPSYVAGDIAGAKAGDRDLALAVNGEIVATARSFPDLGPNGLNWAMLFPHAKLRSGRNEVELLEIDGPRLTRLSAAP
jgi:hypothetical protein